MQPAGKTQELALEMVATNDLKIGMYVHELDRPWLETPFMFQGFCISKLKEIEILSKYCDYVYIDRKQGTIDPRIIHARADNKRQEVARVQRISRKTYSNNKYSDSVIVENELGTARVIYKESNSAVENIFNRALNDGEVNIAEASKTTKNIVDSILRNPDAFMLLQRIREKDTYRYNHAINCCALAATFCRHMGFSRDEIQNISLGGLMLDIGIIKLPTTLLNSTDSLGPEALEQVRSHVVEGIKLIDKTQDIPAIVRKMIMTHHERVNGKGYPAGLKGEQIPVCGMIAAIVDCYDAMISNRPYRKSITPTEAICAMYKWRNTDFNEDLIEQFIQCIGTYPTGSLVELNSGQVGIVISQNRVRRLYPKVLVILNADKIKYTEPHIIDLWEYAQKSKGDVLDIKRVLGADELDIDVSDYYLL